jgi:hypothetical protein
VLVAVLCAAMTGLTYAVVALSKESRVGDNGVMVVKGTDTPVATGGAPPGSEFAAMHCAPIGDPALPQPGFAAICQPGVDVCLPPTPQARRW